MALSKIQSNWKGMNSVVLYTPLVESDIFPQSEEDKRKFITYEGRTIRVSQIESGDYQIEQLLSTNPQDYLNMNFAPGTLIHSKY